MLPVWLTDTVTPNLDRAVHYTLLWGLEGVELRTVGGAGDRVPFVNEAKLKRRLAENELPVAAIEPGLFEGPEADRVAWMNEVVGLGELFGFCRRVGCGVVVVGAFSEGGAAEYGADALRRAGTAATRHGITLAVKNTYGMARATGTALAVLLDAVGHPSVRAAWSPADGLQAGEAAAVGLAALGDRVALVRCRDGKGTGAAWTPALPGEGAVGWHDQFRQLHGLGFDGPVSLEVDLDPRPRHGLHAAAHLIRLLRQARKG